MKVKHHGDKPVTCVACITLAEKEKMPWHKDWGDALISKYSHYEKVHKIAIIRSEQRRANK